MDTKRGLGELFTFEQLAGPQIFNSVEVAKKYVAKKPKVVHPDPDLADIEFWEYTRHSST